MINNIELPIGYKISGYKILKKISYGGFSIVYLAYDKDNKPYAIKEFFPSNLHLRSKGDKLSFINDVEKTKFMNGLKNFKNETEIVMNIKHNNIINIINFFEYNGTAYIVMPYEYGTTLNKYVMLSGLFNEKKIISIAIGVFSAIQKFHENGVVHLDLKPNNIWVRPSGEALILDFGAARNISDFRSDLNIKMPPYTPGYAAPEQHKEYYKPSRIGPWTDYYALGATIYALFNKSAPDLSINFLKENKSVDVVEKFMGQYHISFLNFVEYLMQPEWNKRKKIDFKNVIEILVSFKDFDNMKTNDFMSFIDKDYGSFKECFES